MFKKTMTHNQDSSTVENDVLLELKNLKTHFHTHDGVVRAVDGVNLTLKRGRTLGIVGESGCGKTILTRSIMRIVPEPPAKITGDILWHRQGSDVVNLAKHKVHSKQLREIRGKEISMIFQEPMSSFSPVHTVGNQIAEALLTHQNISKSSAKELAIEMIDRVGIAKPAEQFDAYPFELSGGMRQRAMIAMALMCKPTLLIADEPTTALDVTVEAAILKLMKSLQAQMNMTILIITHDLGVIAKMADDVAVMYLGKIVEQGSVETLFDNPQHPYTQALLKSMPSIKNAKKKLESIEGNLPDPYTIIPGCPFYSRCNEAQSGICDANLPQLRAFDDDHLVRCFMREDRH